MTINLLSKIPLFSDLPKEELDHLQSTLEVKYIQTNEILFNAGEKGEHFYLVMEGELHIVLGSGTNEENADKEWLYLTGDDYDKYRECLDSLANETELANVTRRDLDVQLWDFTIDVEQNYKEYQDREAKINLISAFLVSLEPSSD